MLVAPHPWDRVDRPGGGEGNTDSDSLVVGLRDGRFCAHPLLKRLGLPSGSLRASFGVGSRLEDAERLLAGIRDLRTKGLGWDYVVDAGRWVPAHDNRTYPHWAPNTPGTAGAAPCIDD